MSLIARAGHRFSYGPLKHICSPVIASCSGKSTLLTRHFAQPAILKYEEEEVEIDQRLLPTDYDPLNFDPKNHRQPPTERVWRLVDTMAGLTLAEAADLSDIIFDKFCYMLMKRLTMKERRVIMDEAAKRTETSSVKEEKKAEKTVFELVIESYEAASKLKVIKEIRSFAGLGLKEAKDLVEKAPAVVKKGVSKEEARDTIEKMKAIGAKVVMV
ncbi:hypothetical protein OROMI_027122 [Orobanche minor]